MSIYSSSTTTPDLDSFPGRTGTFEFDGLSFGVKIVKARLRFGHLDLLITPSVGNGERWVEQHRVILDDNVIRNVIGVIGPKRDEFVIPAFTDSAPLTDHA
jgi:hypothetical protein